MIKPERLQAGDLVRVIAPASPFNEQAFHTGIQALEHLGLRVRYDEGIIKRQDTLPYLSGDDAVRIAELHQAFEDKETKAIFCARGGYGTLRILDQVRGEIISSNPKIFVGYSDCTSLLTLFTQQHSLVTFQGPVVAKDLDQKARPKTLEWLRRAIMDPAPFGECVLEELSNEPPLVIRPGSAKGILVGGNLSLICATLGTPYEIQTDGKILFIEDTGERAYRVDRLLQQLRLSGKLKRVAGILIGTFIPNETENVEAIIDVFQKCFAEGNTPVLYGFPSGHVPEKMTLPLGVSATLDADQKTICITESALTAA